jgi:hypothetical protein
MTWRLGLRLARGADRVGAVRLVLLSVGIALAVCSVLISLALPRALNAQVERAAARLPVPAAPGQTGSFLYVLAEDQLGDRPLTSISLAATTSGAPVPPGLDRLPAPGTAVLSPALAALRDSTGPVIGNEGLAAPDELLEYRGVSPADLAGGASTGTAFGQPTSAVRRAPVQRVALTLVLLVVLPAGVFLSTCARLSSATRLQRLSALRLLGLRRGALVRVAAVETAVAGLLGAIGGLLLYRLLLPPVASSGVVGTTWFTSQTALSPVHVAIALVLVVWGAAVLGSRGMARALDRPLEARREPERRAPSWRGAALLVTGSAVLSLFAVLPLMGRRPQIGSGTATLVVVVAAALALTGFVLLLQPVLGGLAEWLGRATSLDLRLAGRRLAVDSASTARVLGGLVLLCLLAGAGVGVLRDAELAVNAPLRQLLVSVPVPAGTPQEAFERMVALDAEAVLGQTAAQGARNGTAQSIPVVVATCESLEVVANVVEGDCVTGKTYALRALPGFEDQSVGIALSPESAPPNRSLRAVGELIEVAPQGALLVTDAGLLAGRWGERTEITYLASDIAAADSLRATVRDIVPTAPAGTGVDVVTATTFRLLDRTGRTGLLTGFTIAVLTFVVAAADRAYERRPNVVALAVVGVPYRLLRRIQVLQLLVPLLVVVGAALAVGNLIGLGWIGAGGLERGGLYTEGLALSAAMLIVSVLLAVGAGALTVRRGIRTEHLRRA